MPLTANTNMYEQRLQFIKQLAWKAGQLSLEGFGRCGHVSKESKVDYDIVTEYDHRVEQLVRDAVAAEYGEPVLGEEFGLDEDSIAASEQDLWIVDPIDGTFNYRFGIPLYGVVLSYCEKRVPVVGAIYLPALEELFVAAEGMGAWLHRKLDGTGKRLHADSTQDVNEMVFAVGGEHTRATFDAYFDEGLPRRSLRCFLCAAVPIPYIADGRMHAYLQTTLNVWDCSAGDIILREAGAPAPCDEHGVPIFPTCLNRKLAGEGDGEFVFLAASDEHAQALGLRVLRRAGIGE